MKNKKPWGAASVVLTIVIAIFILAPGAWAASKYKTLHVFTGDEGRAPLASLIFDQAGNLYGTTDFGGFAFKLTPNADGSWTESSLYAVGSSAPLIFDGNGNLYGTAYYAPGIHGEVFELTPNLDGSWTPNVLYAFCPVKGCHDGSMPSGGLVIDQAGNLYGTTSEGGAKNRGTVFKLTPNGDGSWSQSLLHSFTGGNDGGVPGSGLIFDKAGNLYGTTSNDGVTGYGVVFKLTPNANGTWTEKVLRHFTGGKDGDEPRGVVFDPVGNLYGTTSYGGTYGKGVVFELTPQSNGKWTEKVLHHFTGNKDGSVPNPGLIFDRAGNLYGTTPSGGAYRGGVAFRLTPNAKGGWNETVLHAFRFNKAAIPLGGLILDGAGNLYGTTSWYNNRSDNFNGTVFEITP